MAMLVHRDNICEYSIRSGKAVKRIELNVKPLGKRCRKAHDFAATFCNGFLYMFGGRWGNNNSMTGAAKFNVRECTWSWGAPMPTARSAACAVTAGDTIYVVGGRTGAMEPLDDDVEIVEQYSTLEDIWANAPSLNRRRAYCSALLVGHKIFVLGGSTSLRVESLDLHDPTAWHDLPTKMPISRHSSSVAVAVDQKIYVLGGWNRNGQSVARSGSVLDLGSLTWAKLPRLPVDHDYFSQALALDGAVYVFGASNTGGVSKYEPNANRWLMLPPCKATREGCYLARLVEQPLHSSGICPLQGDEQQPWPGRVHQPVAATSPVIQIVQHPDEAAAVDPGEAAAVVEEQWAQQAQLNVGASSSYSQPPGLLLRLMLLDFSRHPAEFHTALLEGPELHSCREQMQGLPCKLDSGTLVFLEPFQYNVAIDAAMREHGHLTVHQVITSERFESNIMQAVRGLRSRLNVRLRKKQVILQPLEVEVARTFLDVPDRSLRNIASVTHSTTDAHGGRNPRIVAS